MSQIPKLLIGVGITLIIVGVLWMVGGKWFHLRLGRLPGDIVIEKENFRFYFPIVTCILISILLSAIFAVIRWFTK
jgi:hypothetical protein